MPPKTQKYNRRSFFSKSAAGLVTAGLASLAGENILADENATETRAKVKKIITRKLGKTGLEIPIVSMGVMNASIPNIIQQSYEIGIRHFDTAAYYQSGKNEEMVGHVINKMGIRDKAVIATKALIPKEREGLNPKETKEKFLEIFNGSLKRLNMDYVDILYFHNISTADEVNNPGVQEAFSILKDQKKIRFAGVTTHRGTTSVLNEVAKTDFYDVVLVALNVALSGYKPLFEAIESVANKGIGLIAMKTQAGGQWWKYVENGYGGPVNQTAALKWVLNNKNITTAIPGHTDPEQLAQNFSVAYDLEYTDEEKKFFDEASVMLGANFCWQCDKCLASCPSGVEIPTLMRTHMYAAQYSNFHQARATLDEIPRQYGLKVCLDCSNCTATCHNAIDIPGRIAELKLIYA